MPSIKDVDFNVSKIKLKDVWRKTPLSLLILGITLVFGLVSIGMGIAAQLHDSKWNAKLDSDNIMENIRKESTVNGKTVFTKETYRLFYRDTWMKKAFLSITSFLVVSTIIHMTVYILYDDEHYRYNFAILFAVVAVFLYIASGVFMITSTVTNSNHYDEILELATNNKIQFNKTKYLILFEMCGDEDITGKNSEKIDGAEVLREEADQLGICQLSGIRFAAGVLALINVLWMGGVILTTHSKRTAEDEALSLARDLEYDRNDADWTAPLSTFHPGPRRATVTEVAGMPKDIEGDVSESMSEIDQHESLMNTTNTSKNPPQEAH